MRSTNLKHSYSFLLSQTRHHFAMSSAADKKPRRWEDKASNKLEKPSKWQFVTHSILFHIFSYLGASDLVRFAEVCRSWKAVATDEMLWKALFYKDWKPSGPFAPNSWLSEYKRLKYHAPLHQSEVLTEHDGPVLHVSFSNDGSMFASTSTDGSVKLWNVNYPSTVRYDINMIEYHWVCAQFSQFNRNDTLLLVCGRNNSASRSGEIIVFDINNDFLAISSASNDPFSIFSVWCDSHRFLSGRTLRFAQGISSTTIWKNSVYPVNEPSMRKMYTFFNMNFNFVGSIMVAGFTRDEPVVGEETTRREGYLIFTMGYETCVPHVIRFRNIEPPVGNDDDVDHCINVRGHILGLALSPDQRHLYFNHRPWPENFVESSETDRDVVIGVIDLRSLTLLESIFTSHKSDALNDILFLDVSSAYVTSGSEDNKGYIWDRNHGICLGRFSHDNCVNCVVLSPADSEILITASDDNTLKLWRSKNRIKELITVS